MEYLDDYGVVVTSFEINENGEINPIITHIGWGKSIKQAVGYLKSHLISDYFFNSTFNGEMKWQDGKLKLVYRGKIISIVPISNKKALENDVFDELEDEVRKVTKMGEDYNLPNIINEMSKYK